jgi:hypothetical protein
LDKCVKEYRIERAADDCNTAAGSDDGGDGNTNSSGASAVSEWTLIATVPHDLTALVYTDDSDHLDACSDRFVLAIGFPLNVFYWESHLLLGVKPG